MKAFALMGMEGVMVDITWQAGGPFALNGLSEHTARETAVRVRAAMRNSGLTVPTSGTVYVAGYEGATGLLDLPIAMLLSGRADPSTAYFGELSLDGRIEPVSGLLPMLEAARNAGIRHVVVPEPNEQEARLVAGIAITACRTLDDALKALPPPIAYGGPDFCDVRAQDDLVWTIARLIKDGKRPLMVGPPGAGKTMIARRIPGILQPLTYNERMETCRVYSVAGLLRQRGTIENRPFRAPHSTCSHAALVGGGTPPRPGEVSLAHNGVLFLDEMAEFQHRTLECLRQPLEDGHVMVARAKRVMTFPARFLLVGACNPCPCGHHGSTKVECRCDVKSLESYERRIAWLETTFRMTRVPITHVSYNTAVSGKPGPSSTEIRRELWGE